MCIRDSKYDFLPYTEVENECTIMPNGLEDLIDCWNNSPKLSNSGNPECLRYQPEILKALSAMGNAWFKFVIKNNEDWREIEQDFLNTGFIQRSQIVLMPEGASREDLERNREKVVEIAIRKNVRYSSREQIELWDRKTGM